MDKELKHITRKELGWMVRNINLTKWKKDKAKKLILVVDNRYRIFIDGQHTFVEKENNPMIALKESEMPQYIHQFVF
jgi:uncharacterized protein YjhX (UPF0386 family)